MWEDVYEDFSELSKSEQLALFEAIKQDLFPEEPDKITKLLNTIREARFASGMACVHCGSMSVKRNGKYRSRQRYPSALLCTDTATNYKKFAKLKGLPYETINERQKQRVKKGIYHIYWFRWPNLGKNLAFGKRVEQMLISACQKSNYLTVEELRSA